MKKVGIISDTHGVFDGVLEGFLADVDEVWHAGDIGSVALADRIAEFKPLRAVHGNIDDAFARRIYPEFACFECEDLKILMTHTGGYPGRYTPQAYNKIVSCRPDIFISGHSHILKVMYDKSLNLLHINPGSAGKYGFHNVRTAVRLQIDGTGIGNLEIGEWEKQNKL